MQISVIIPSHKPQDYLWQCLDSLREQTLPTTEFEVVLVLNGEKEPYFEQIERYSQEHSELNISLLHTDVAGVSHARNIGLDHAKGEYIAFIDDDDFVSPTYLSEMLGIARQGCVPLANIRSFVHETNEEVFDYLNISYRKNYPEAKSLWKASGHFAVAVLKLIPRHIALSRRFDEKLTNGEDSLYAFAISHNFNRFRCTPPDAVYHRRVRANSLSHNAPGKQLRQLPRQFFGYIREWLRHPFSHNLIFFLSNLLTVIRKTGRFMAGD